MRGLRCCAGFSLAAASVDYSLVGVRGLLLVRSTGSRAHGCQRLWFPGSRAQAQQLRCTGFIAPWHLGPSWTRDWTCVSCIAGGFFSTEPLPPGRPGCYFVKPPSIDCCPSFTFSFPGIFSARDPGCWPSRAAMPHRNTGTSLVAQWLRLCASNAGGPGSISGQGTRSYMLQLRPSTAK